MGQEGVYQTVTDLAITVRFPLASVPEAAPAELAGADLLVWTTTPWTLVSNTAVAVHPEASYVVDPSPDANPTAETGWWRRIWLGRCSITTGGRGPVCRSGATRGEIHRPFGIKDIPDAHVVIQGHL